jgi:site-specific recombinase XerD
MGRKTFRDKITSPELTKQINPENIKLMEKFLKDKAIRTSAKTIVVYESNLTMFLTWNLLYNENKFFIDIKKLEFSDFFSFASTELKLGSARLNNLRSTLSSLSSFIEKFYDEDYPNFRNVILRIVESSPKEMRREKTILTDEQVENLLEYLKKTDKQQACWIALAVTSGARFTELLCFETDLIDENRTAFADLFLETTRQIKTKGRGKSGKLLYKYILKEKFLPYYKEWLEERNKILKQKKLNHNFLFIKQDGTPATGATVRGWIDSFEKYLGVPLYAHALRHYLVTLFSKKNIPQPLIKELMGWSSSEMIQIYDDTSARDRIYEGLENLKL